MKTTATILAAALLASPAAFASDPLVDVFSQMARNHRRDRPRYRPLQDGASKQQLRALRRDVGQLMRILRGYSFLEQMGGDWAQYQMARKISAFKKVAASIEQQHDLRGSNWVAGSEYSRWQFLCKAITTASWQITNPRAAPQVTQAQKVQTAAEALSRGLQMIGYAELRPYANHSKIDGVVNKVLWAPVAPPPPPGPGIVVVDASSRVTTNVSQRVTSVQQHVTSVQQHVTQVAAPTTVIAPRTNLAAQHVNAAPGSVVSAAQRLAQ